jgi:predicted ATP-grasp superfamily ATP-dependent carboligase
MISRNRERLGEAFRFVVPDPELTETLVDKLRFQELAERLGLPVPRTRYFPSDAGSTINESDLRFPVIVKPLMRINAEWSPVAGLGKAVSVDTEEKLIKLKQSLDQRGIDFIAQEMIPGAESAIESYHVYVDGNGQIAGEFTGKKIRTYPKEFGQSCALTISDAQDVAELGRELVKKLDLRGLAKFDFKRTPDDQLHLLEVNPRFSLWHHLGAAAGLNLPLLVYCDLVGQPRPVFEKAKAGTNWCRMWQDVHSARADGIPLRKWLPWALSCEAKPGISADDPLPLLGAFMWRTMAKVGVKL